MFLTSLKGFVVCLIVVCRNAKALSKLSGSRAPRLKDPLAKCNQICDLRVIGKIFWAYHQCLGFPTAFDPSIVTTLWEKSSCNFDNCYRAQFEHLNVARNFVRKLNIYIFLILRINCRKKIMFLPLNFSSTFLDSI